MLTAYQFNRQTGAMGQILGVASLGATRDPDVIRLQKALIALAAKVPSANPGTADGIVGKKTIAAVAAAISVVPQIPSYIKTAFRVMNLSTIFSSTAREKAESMVKQYAKQLAMGIEAYLVVAGPVTTQVTTQVTKTDGKEAPITYPAGTVHYYNSGKGQYFIAVPKNDGLGAIVHGFGLGDSQFGEATHSLRVSSADPTPQGSTLSTKSDVEKKTGTEPFYKKWWFWTGVGSVFVIGTGYVVFRRKPAV